MGGLSRPPLNDSEMERIFRVSLDQLQKELLPPTISVLLLAWELKVGPDSSEDSDSDNSSLQVIHSDSLNSNIKSYDSDRTASSSSKPKGRQTFNSTVLLYCGRKKDHLPVYKRREKLVPPPCLKVNIRQHNTHCKR